jgi:hypothetical protein
MMRLSGAFPGREAEDAGVEGLDFHPWLIALLAEHPMEKGKPITRHPHQEMVLDVKVNPIWRDEERDRR